ncbi:MAG: hypothetical protein IT262_10410 [Saprospiraceae bacterium]|jgi:hypothetical protein|nr:hypothetical protein [Saprospiraceae bacterium]
MDTFNSNNDLHPTAAMENYWRTTSKWAMFFAVLGFIGAGLYLLGAMAIIPMLRMMSSMGAIPEPVASMIGSFSWLFVLLYLLGVASMFFLAFFHLKFSNGISRALNFTDQNAFELAWRNLRNHFRLNGILIIVGIVLYIVMILVVVSLASSTLDQINN